jgi:hypothetical protein
VRHAAATGSGEAGAGAARERTETAWVGLWLGRGNEARGPIKVKSPLFKKNENNIVFFLVSTF